MAAEKPAKKAPAKPRARKTPTVAPDADAPAPPAKAPKPKRADVAADAPRAPVQKTRVVFAKAFYEPHKDEVKAPFKAHGLKWNYLGDGKGLYKKDGAHCFAQFLDDGVHYSIWGSDDATVKAILDAWRVLLGDAAFASATAAGETAALAEEKQEESDAMRLWKIGEPQRRPGEPDLFFDKRRAEWLAKKPAA